MGNIDKLEEKLLENRLALRISRVPKKTLDLFRQIANEDDFCKDYGMTLKMLVDYYIEDQKIMLIHSRLDEIEQKLKSFEEKPETRTINLMNGRKIQVKKKEE